MQALLTPVEKYKQTINRDYLLAARNPVANNVKWKNGEPNPPEPVIKITVPARWNVQFITTMKSFDTGKKEYFTILQAVAEMAHKDQYENVKKVPEKLSNKVQEGQVKIKLNRFKCV